MKNQIQKGHLAGFGGPLKLKQTPKTNKQLAHRANQRYTVEKMQPAALNWKSNKESEDGEIQKEAGGN